LVTISLPLAVWGNDYTKFFERWIEGVRLLARKPDEIVIATDKANEGIASSLNIDIPIKTLVYEFADYRLWDLAIRNCSSEWVAICNIDDQFLPNALDQINQADEAGANLLVDSLRVKGTGHRWTGYWDAATIPYRFTMPGAEPMKKNLYIEAGGYDSKYQFPDWALAVHMVHKDLARPFTANTERIIFDAGDDRITMSGNSANPQLKAAGTAQVRELSKSLGLLLE
jgi:hypothetical protein